MAQETDHSSQEACREPGRVTLFLAGDVMTGRGVDQVLPHPCDPELFESYIKSATGYVAYVGWNPWDGRRRAYIVIIGHAGGYETIYAHLKPVRKVRAGQLVRQGQTIGLSGNTGRSTGPHVHWEVSRGFRTMDPRSV